MPTELRMPVDFARRARILKLQGQPCILGRSPASAAARAVEQCFFSGCPLKCVFCQNEKISHGNFGREVTPLQLMHIFDSLIEQGAHNINLVSPTHFAPQLRKILEEYKSSVPVVYNTSGYETVETLQSLEGLVDIYLPDMKYYDSEISQNILPRQTILSMPQGLCLK